MKILFSVPRIHTNYTGMIKGLIAEGHQISFITMNGDDIYIPFNLNVSVHHFEPNKGINFPSPYNKILHFEGFQRLKRVLDKEEPDLVIARDLNLLNVQISFLSKLKHIPVLYYDQVPAHYPKTVKRRAWYATVRNLISKHRITTVVQADKTLPPPNTFFIPFAVPVTPTKKIYPAEFSENSPLKIIVVSKLGAKRKNLLFLLDALLPFFKEGTIHLSLYGILRENQDSKKNFNSLKSFIEEHSLTSHINIYSNEVYETVLEAYSDQDLFILPSLNEPAAISPFEAMSSGLPVIVTEQNGTNYAIEEGENGFVFNPYDKNQLQKMIRFFLNHPYEIRRFGKKALSLTDTKFRPSHFSNRLLEIYDFINN